LQHSHEQGIVHRDLKPGNLMLVPTPKPDSTLNSSVKILDIGLGKVMFDEDQPAGLEQVQLTTDGAILGAPEYMAPEQAKDAHKADIRADIYSLGCVLYHCLAGVSPYTDVNVVRIMVKHATEQPKPLRQFNPQVPDGLQQIVNYMLAKDPAQRYQTPDRAAQALQVFLASANEPSKPLEADPGMRDYLNWLDSQVVPAEYVAPAPAPGSPLPQPMVSPSGADVELVPQGPVQTNLGRKDMLLLGIVVGIGLVVGAVVLGVIMSLVLRR
jgi:serine/threonine protein kinase